MRVVAARPQVVPRKLAHQFRRCQAARYAHCGRRIDAVGGDSIAERDPVDSVGVSADTRQALPITRFDVLLPETARLDDVPVSIDNSRHGPNLS